MFFNQQTSSRRVDHVFIMFPQVFGEKSRTMHADLPGGPLLKFLKITNTLLNLARQIGPAGVN